MKRAFSILSVGLAVVLLAGCISVETTVKLNRDGSGQIIEKVGISKEIASMATAMSGAEEQGPKPFSTEQFENSARDLGEGVKLVSVNESEGAHMKFFEAVYAFDNINKVGIDQNQGNKMSSPGRQGGSKKKEPIVFNFSAGGDDSTLTIRLPDSEGGDFEAGSSEEEEEEIAPPEMEEADLEMMKMMFKGMRFAITIVFNGEIVETNATNVDGNTIALLDINFDRLMDDAERLKELNARQPEGIEEVKELLKDVEGLKFEFEEEVTVRFE